MTKPLSVAFAVLLLLFPIVIAEAGTRVLIGTGRLPLAPAGDRLAEIGLANLERRGRPDILIVGTSSIRNAIKPDVLEALAREATGRDVAVQGIAQSAISLKAQRLLVKGLALRGLLPDVVLLGVSSISLSGDHQDGDWLLRSELGRLWNGCDPSLDLEATMACWLGQVSALWRWHGRPDRLVDAVRKGMPATAREGDRHLQEDGWVSQKPASRRALRRMLPAALGRLMERISVPAAIAIDYADLINELRSHGVTVVTVGLPYSAMLEDALVARNPTWKQERSAGYDLFEQVARTEIIEVDGYGDWWEPGSHYDLRHLSREGAGPFTRQLWDMPAFRDAVLAGLAEEA